MTTTKALRRLLLALPLTLVASFAAFSLSHLAGGSYFDQFKTDQRYTPAQIRELERKARLDQPMLVQYFSWLRGICFDVRVGRPRRELLGFEEPLATGSGCSFTSGMSARISDEQTHAGRGALEVSVPEGGGELRLALVRAPCADSRGGARADAPSLEAWLFSATGGRASARVEDGGASAEPAAVELRAAEWTRVALERSGAALMLRFDAPGTWYVDSIAEVERGLAFSCGRPDFGRSFKYDTPVFELLLPSLWNSCLLAFASLAVTFAIAVPLGVVCAVRRDRLADRLSSLCTFAGMSVPGFFLALLALLATVSWINGESGVTLLPIGSDRSLDHASLSWCGRVLDRAWHLVLPVIVLSAGAIATIQRTLRGNLIEVLRLPFVTAARARGVGERVVVLRHALRNALNPLVTIFGVRLAELLSGAALVEIVFQYPGMGRLVLEATIGRDLYVVMGAVLAGSLVLVVANLLADLALTALDPRIDGAGSRR